MADSSSGDWWQHDDEPDLSRRRAQASRRSRRTTDEVVAPDSYVPRGPQTGAAPSRSTRSVRTSETSEVIGPEFAPEYQRPNASDGWGNAESLTHARSRQRRDAYTRGHDVPQFSARRHPATSSHSVRLTPQRPVPQIRDTAARNGGWNLPSLNQKRSGHGGVAGYLAACPKWLLILIAVLVVLLIVLLIHMLVA